jgi:hypothetical protein
MCGWMIQTGGINKWLEVKKEFTLYLMRQLWFDNQVGYKFILSLILVVKI